MWRDIFLPWHPLIYIETQTATVFIESQNWTKKTSQTDLYCLTQKIPMIRTTRNQYYQEIQSIQWKTFLWCDYQHASKTIQTYFASEVKKKFDKVHGIRPRKAVFETLSEYSNIWIFLLDKLLAGKLTLRLLFQFILFQNKCMTCLFWSNLFQNVERKKCLSDFHQFCAILHFEESGVILVSLLIFSSLQKSVLKTTLLPTVPLQ